jgi:hypothetical protein
MKEGTGEKECIDIQGVYSMMSHIDDAKVTFTNGFHVNHALTKTN